MVCIVACCVFASSSSSPSVVVLRVVEERRRSEKKDEVESSSSEVAFFFGFSLTLSGWGRDLGGRQAPKARFTFFFLFLFLFIYFFGYFSLTTKQRRDGPTQRKKKGRERRCSQDGDMTARKAAGRDETMRRSCPRDGVVVIGWTLTDQAHSQWCAACRAAFRIGCCCAGSTRFQSQR